VVRLRASDEVRQLCWLKRPAYARAHVTLSGRRGVGKRAHIGGCVALGFGEVLRLVWCGVAVGGWCRGVAVGVLCRGCWCGVVLRLVLGISRRWCWCDVARCEVDKLLV
jgi:hypothetical protein